MDTQGSHVRSREQPWTQVCGGEDCIEEAVERFFIVFRDGAVAGFQAGMRHDPISWASGSELQFIIEFCRESQSAMVGSGVHLAKQPWNFPARSLQILRVSGCPHALQLYPSLHAWNSEACSCPVPCFSFNSNSAYNLLTTI